MDAEAGVAGADLRRFEAESVVSLAGRFLVEEGAGFGVGLAAGLGVGLGVAFAADLAGDGDLVELLAGVDVGLDGGLGETVFAFLAADLVGVLLLEVERFFGVLFCGLFGVLVFLPGVGIVLNAADCRRQN